MLLTKSVMMRPGTLTKLPRNVYHPQQPPKCVPPTSYLLPSTARHFSSNLPRKYVSSKNYIPIALFVLATTSIGYSVHRKTSSPVVLTHRKRHLITTPEYEGKVGDVEYIRFINLVFRKQITLGSGAPAILSPQHPSHLRVKSIGDRLIKYSPLLKIDESPKEWNYTVVDDKKMPNAFCLPPNHVIVFSGLFKFTKDDDELAAIIAHEMSHILARHAGEKLSDHAVGTLSISILDYLFGGGWSLLELGKKIGFDLVNSRGMEREADEIGIHLLGAACFDVTKAANVFERMEKQMGRDENLPAVPEWVSTHPSYKERAGNLRNWAKVVEREISGRSMDCKLIKEDWERSRAWATRKQKYQFPF